MLSLERHKGDRLEGGHPWEGILALLIHHLGDLWQVTLPNAPIKNQPPHLLNGKYGTSFQFSSVAQSCPTVCDPMGCSTLGLHVHHQLPEFTQTNVHWVSDAIQPSHPLSSPSPPALSLSQHQGLFKWVSSLHLVVKVSEFQLQHQSFQWIFKTDFL